MKSEFEAFHALCWSEDRQNMLIAEQYVIGLEDKDEQLMYLLHFIRCRSLCEYLLALKKMKYGCANFKAFGKEFYFFPCEWGETSNMAFRWAQGKTYRIELEGLWDIGLDMVKAMGTYKSSFGGDPAIGETAEENLRDKIGAFMAFIQPHWTKMVADNGSEWYERILGDGKTF